MNILLIDNYDSFTYNLVHILQELGQTVDVRRNDCIELDEVEQYDRIMLSPGPGIPSEAGILLPVIKRYAPTKPILGVCLGEQAIAEAFGGKLENLSTVYHGICSDIRVKNHAEQLFRGICPVFQAGRYHSWVVSRKELPECLEVIAEDVNEQLIMGIRHREYNVCGIQFHPESVLTPDGRRILQNWLTPLTT